MNKDLFTSKALGRLKRINIQDSPDWAFIPDPLPKHWKIPYEIWPLLAEAREELARLDGVGRHMPNYELLLKPLQQREAIRSSSMEGTYATPEQLLLFELDPREPKSHNDPINAWKEVSNYGKALRRGHQLLEKIPISIRLIKELHKQLMSGVRGHHRDSGQFRRTQVFVGSDRRYIPPAVPEMKKCLFDMEEYINKDIKIDPLILCFMVHYQFEAIHPFLDGNGRIGRLLLSIMIYKLCNLTSPWLYLSSYFDRYKDEYIHSLFNVSAKGDWDSWISFCLRATIYQAKDARKRFDKLVNLKEKYLLKMTRYGGNIRLHKLIEKLFELPALTTPQAASILDITFPTAKNDIEALIRLKILIDSKLSQRPKIFLAPEIILLAYSDEG